MTKVIITGSAGFIGYHFCRKLQLCDKDFLIIGIDNFNGYYDVQLKRDRVAILSQYGDFDQIDGDIANREELSRILADHKDVEYIFHLGAQAGIRYSVTNPEDYVTSNIMGTVNLFEEARHCQNLRHIIYASSSSVYGANQKIPFSEDDEVSKPRSVYASSKLMTEHLAYNYANMYNINMTGLRFFTVYGEYGRPDMAIFKFTKAIVNNETIEVYNMGKMSRDFTHVDDIVNGMYDLWQMIKDSKALPKNEIYNLGNNKPESLMTLVEIIEESLGKKANIVYKEMQLGDVENTYADITKAQNAFGFYPKTNFKEGVNRFVEWYLDYYESRKN